MVRALMLLSLLFAATTAQAAGGGVPPGFDLANWLERREVLYVVFGGTAALTAVIFTAVAIRAALERRASA
ncbi:MAG: hypothetical protein ACU0CO_12400 [Shimia sp.]